MNCITHVQNMSRELVNAHGVTATYGCRLVAATLGPSSAKFFPTTSLVPTPLPGLLVPVSSPSASTALSTLAFMKGHEPLFSLQFITTNARIITSQNKLYPMTLPYVALFCQPRMALKMPQPPPPLTVGLQQLTCQTLCRMSYEPGPEPFSELSPPVR